ncbi:MAG: hypothetical protein H6685_00600 [Deltaproteobacteria bacterium]|nr:hypothetical protein [Deltaproteobacteria bacterium]
MKHSKSPYALWRLCVLAIALVMLAPATACKKASSDTGMDAPATTVAVPAVVTKDAEDDELTDDLADGEGDVEAAREYDPVAHCVDAHEALFGEQGCLPDQLSPERIQAACIGYQAWVERGDACGSEALADFFDCLHAIECTAFDLEDDNRDNETYPRDFLLCRQEFARDMDPCVDESARKHIP